jgi:hypothetical protein
MNFLKGFFGFYKFLFDTQITFEELYGRAVSFAIFVSLVMILLDYVGLISLGGK